MRKDEDFPGLCPLLDRQCLEEECAWYVWQCNRGDGVEYYDCSAVLFFKKMAGI